VRWGTDEDGRLVPVDTREARRMSQPAIIATAICPTDAGPGQTVEVEVGEERLTVTVPAGVAPGESFQVFVGDSEQELESNINGAGGGDGQAPVTVGDVTERIRKLQTPLVVQVRFSHCSAQPAKHMSY
jgi:hypothetical protein